MTHPSRELLQVALHDATDTRQVVIGAGALASVIEVFRQSFGDRAAVVIADGNTFDVAGHEVQRQLAANRPDFNGKLRSAEDVHAVSLANLKDE